MPQTYEVELEDGRIVELESDREPTEQDISSALESWKPEPEEPKLGDLSRPAIGNSQSLTNADIPQNVQNLYDSAPKSDRWRQLEAEKQQVIGEREGSKVARIGSAIEKSQMLPGKIVYGAMDLAQGLPWSQAARSLRERFAPQSVNEHARKVENMPGEWLKYYARREQQLSREDAALDNNSYAGQLLEGVTRGVAELPLQMVGGVMGAGQTAAMKGAAIGQGIISGLSQYSQDRGEGRGRGESAALGATAGIIDGVTTLAGGATGIESLFAKDGIKGVINKVIYGLKQAGFEGLEESTAQIQHELVDYMARNPDKTIKDAVESVMMAGTIGTFIGGGVGGVSSVFAPGTQAPAEVPPGTLNVDVEAFNKANAPTAESGPLTEEQYQQQFPVKPLPLRKPKQPTMQQEQLPVDQPAKPEMSEAEYEFRTKAKEHGFEGEVEFVDKADIKEGELLGKSLSVASDGRIRVNRAAWEALTPKQRAKELEQITSEEAFHSHTKDQDALDFVKNSTPLQRAISEKIYLTGADPSMKVSELQLGKEMLRRTLQRLNRIKPTELNALIGKEKWTVASLDVADRAIQSIREALGTDATKAQLAALNRVQGKITMAKAIIRANEQDEQEKLKLEEDEAADEVESDQAVNERMATQKEEADRKQAKEDAEQAEYDRLEQEGMSAAPIRTAQAVISAERGTKDFDADAVAEMSDDELNKLMTAKDPGGALSYVPQYGSSLWGASQPASEAAKVEGMAKEAQKRMMAELGKGPQMDKSKFQAEYARMLWYNGALEGIRREGGNYRTAIEKQSKPATPEQAKSELGIRHDGETGGGKYNTWTIMEDGVQGQNFITKKDATLDEIRTKMQSIKAGPQEEAAAPKREDSKKAAITIQRDAIKKIESAGNPKSAWSEVQKAQELLLEKLISMQRQLFAESEGELPFDPEYSADEKFILDLRRSLDRSYQDRWEKDQQSFAASPLRGGGPDPKRVYPDDPAILNDAIGFYERHIEKARSDGNREETVIAWTKIRDDLQKRLDDLTGEQSFTASPLRDRLAIPIRSIAADPIKSLKLAEDSLGAVLKSDDRQFIAESGSDLLWFAQDLYEEANYRSFNAYSKNSKTSRAVGDEMIKVMTRAREIDAAVTSHLKKKFSSVNDGMVFGAFTKFGRVVDEFARGMDDQSYEGKQKLREEGVVDPGEIFMPAYETLKLIRNMLNGNEGYVDSILNQSKNPERLRREWTSMYNTIEMLNPDSLSDFMQQVNRTFEAELGGPTQGYEQSFTASPIRRGGGSDKSQRLAEQRRRIIEMQAAARGEELPPELQSKSKPASGSEAEPVNPKFRSAPESLGIPAPDKLLRTPADYEAKAQEVLAQDIKAESGGFQRGSFDEFAKYANRNSSGMIAPHALREVWEDAVWRHLLKLNPERLTKWRQALSLEARYGKAIIAPFITEVAKTEAQRLSKSVLRPGEGGEITPSEATWAARKFNRQFNLRRAQDLKGIEAGQRYRNKVINAIARTLVTESFTDRPSLTREKIELDDLDFANSKTHFGPYVEFSRDDISNPVLLNRVLRDQARASHSDPESASRRLVAVVGSDGVVELLSTYNDNGIQRVTDPAGARLKGKPSRTLDRTFIGRYRPFASLLLADPVKGFHQRFESVSEFMDKIGEKAINQSRPGDELQTSTPENFEAEGTPGIEGEGGGFVGPFRDTSSIGGGSRAMRSRSSITRAETDNISDSIIMEVGVFENANDVRLALTGLSDLSKRGKLSRAHMLAVNGFRKLYDSTERQYRDLDEQQLLDKMAEMIYENDKTSKDLDSFVKKTMARFPGLNPENVRPGKDFYERGGPRGQIGAGQMAADYVPGNPPAGPRMLGPGRSELAREKRMAPNRLQRRYDYAVQRRENERTAGLQTRRQALVTRAGLTKRNAIRELIFQKRGTLPTRDELNRIIRKHPEVIKNTIEKVNRQIDQLEGREAPTGLLGVTPVSEAAAPMRVNRKASGADSAEYRMPPGYTYDKLWELAGKGSTRELGKIAEKLLELNPELNGINLEPVVREHGERFAFYSLVGGVASKYRPENIKFFINDLRSWASGNKYGVTKTGPTQLRPPAADGSDDFDLEYTAALRRSSGRRTMGDFTRDVLSDFGSIYDKWMVDRIDDYGGPKSQQAAEGFRHIIDRSKELYGQLTPLLDRARRLAGGIEPSKVSDPSLIREMAGKIKEIPSRIKPSINAMRTAKWLGSVENVTSEAGTARTISAIEGKIAIPAWARNLIDAARAANLEIGAILQPVVPGFVATGKFQRNFTSLGYDIIKQGGGKLWENWTEGLAAANPIKGISLARRIAGVRVKFTKIKEQLDDPAVNSTILEKINQDMARSFPETITHVKGAMGAWQSVIHADLFAYLENAARRATNVRAFREQFPNTTAGKAALADMLKEVRAEQPDAELHRDLSALIKSLHGHPTDDYNGGWQDVLRMGPQQFAGQALSMANQTVGNLLAKMVLTGQMFVQPGEVVSGATPVFLGYKNYLKAMAQYRQIYETMELTGSVNRIMRDYTFNPSSPYRSTFRILSNGISKAAAEAALNELQEGLAAATARVVVENIVTGNLSKWEKSMLPQTFKIMGFNRGEVRRMMNGDQELLGQFQRKAAAWLTGGNKSVSENSRLGANRLFNSIFRFQSYPMVKMNQARPVLVNWAESYRDGTPQEKLDAAKMVARFFYGTTMQGAFTTALIALAYGGLSGLKIKLNEGEDEPVKFMLESFLASMSGPMYIIYRGSKARGWRGFGEQAMRAAFPYGIANDFTDMSQGLGMYRDLTTTSRIGKFLANKTPGLQAIKTGLAMAGLASDNQPLEQSLKGLGRWRQNEMGWVGIDFNLKVDERAEFRIQVVRAIEAMKIGDREAFDQAWMNAVEQTDMGSVAASLRQRKVLTSPTGKALTDEEIESLQNRIGVDAYNELEYYDLMLDQAANGLMLPTD